MIFSFYSLNHWIIVILLMLSPLFFQRQEGKRTENGMFSIFCGVTTWVNLFNNIEFHNFHRAHKSPLSRICLHINLKTMKLYVQNISQYVVRTTEVQLVVVSLSLFFVHSFNSFILQLYIFFAYVHAFSCIICCVCNHAYILFCILSQLMSVKVNQTNRICVHCWK